MSASRVATSMASRVVELWDDTPRLVCLLDLRSALRTIARLSELHKWSKTSWQQDDFLPACQSRSSSEGRHKLKNGQWPRDAASISRENVLCCHKIVMEERMSFFGHLGRSEA